MSWKCCIPGCISNCESADKEGRCITFGFPLDETNRQNLPRNIPRHFNNITCNTRLCITHFEEKDVHTFDVHTNLDGSTYRVSYINRLTKYEIVYFKKNMIKNKWQT